MNRSHYSMLARIVIERLVARKAQLDQQGDAERVRIVAETLGGAALVLDMHARGLVKLASNRSQSTTAGFDAIVCQAAKVRGVP